MRNLKFIIEYEGTNYSGWQKQVQKNTVQQTVEDAILHITKEKAVLHGSGRTDSGVHALGQVANFKTNSGLSTTQFQKALNTVLPNDIAILGVEEAPLKFHSQYDSKSKIYVYKILNREYPSAHLRQKIWQVIPKLNVKKMKEASQTLLGTHDFKAFAHAGVTVKTTTRNVINVSLKKKKEIIEFEIEAEGFLKRMVRLIVGTLVQVGRERITPLDFKEILENGEKNKFVIPAPPHGLFLKKVIY